MKCLHRAITHDDGLETLLFDLPAQQDISAAPAKDPLISYRTWSGKAASRSFARR